MAAQAMRNATVTSSRKDRKVKLTLDMGLNMSKGLRNLQTRCADRGQDRCECQRDNNHDGGADHERGHVENTEGDVDGVSRGRRHVKTGDVQKPSKEIAAGDANDRSDDAEHRGFEHEES